MSSFTLDDIREAADKKYGSVNITLDDGKKVVMVNALRLSKDKRKKLTATQKEMDKAAEGDDDAADEADQEEMLEDTLRIVCATEQQAEWLIEAFGGDLAMLAIVFEKYTAGAEAGEASASQT